MQYSVTEISVSAWFLQLQDQWLLRSMLPVYNGYYLQLQDQWLLRRMLPVL
jgi:hypothetical protein